MPIENLGEGTTLILAWSAGACWAVSEFVSLRQPARRDRAWWMAACGLLWLHIACAFEVHHGWSHAAAYAHTARETEKVVGVDWGGGLWFNYAFLLAWTADATLCRRACARAGKAVARLHATVRAAAVFFWFNAAVVFAQGPSRYASMAAFVVLLAVWVAPRAARHSV